MNIEEQLDQVESELGKQIMDEVLTDETRLAMLMNSVTASKSTMQGMVDTMAIDTPAHVKMQGAVMALTSVENTYAAYKASETYRDAVRKMIELNQKNREEAE